MKSVMFGPIDSYSATVQMWLECPDAPKVELGRITPTKVFARKAWKLPPCFAMLVVVVDGDVIRRPVHLRDGFDGRSAVAVSVSDVAPF